MRTVAILFIDAHALKPFCGKPLCYWAIRTASDCKAIDAVMVLASNAEVAKVLSDLSLPKVLILRIFEYESFDLAVYLSDNQKIENFIWMPSPNPFLEASDVESALLLLEASDWVVAASPSSSLSAFAEQENASFPKNEIFHAGKNSYVRAHGFVPNGRVASYQMPAYTTFDLSIPELFDMAEYAMRKYRALPKSPIKLFLSDVDGVLTDASMYYTEAGDELKKFNTHDGMGFVLLAKAGIKTGLITSEDTQMVARRAKKLKLDYLYQGARYRGKLEAALEICEKEGIGMDEVAYIGDDINCIALLERVGLAACPANATHKVKAIPGIIHLERKGGDGAVREFIERHILCEY